ncbi:MAG: hypothetical protein J2P27_03195 [Actinobacteria bacterium]|nr:hypothetical protein [Actinomycetota bacterium]
MPSLAGGESTATAKGTVGPFNNVWTYAASPANQASQIGISLTQLPDGTVVVGGSDGNQPNYCYKRSHPYRGGVWLVAARPSGGQNVWQQLYSTCSFAAQSAGVISGTPDGGLILVGGDFANPACLLGCGWFAELSGQGSILWQHDLTGAPAAGAAALAMLPDGSFVTVGAETTTPAYTPQALIMKVTAAGSLQWSRSYDETDQSFPGAISGANFVFNSIRHTSDGGFIASGVADAKFSAGYAHVLVVMKLDASGAVQWSNVYYGTNWLSGPGGSSPFPIFQTADGGYVVSGTVQGSSYPFQNLFFLLKLDAQGNVTWQKGYGGVNGTFDYTSEQGGAAATSDGGYVLAGVSDVFQQYTNGWIVKTDGSGNILWQKSYTGLTSTGGNTFNDVIQTSDGGFAATGGSWTPDPTYGGPGLWLVKIDPDGSIGTCNCAQDTNTVPQALDLAAYPASFTEAPPGLAFSGVSIQGTPTSLKPTTIYP